MRKHDLLKQSGKRQEGKTLVELILYLGVFMLALVLAISQAHDQNERVIAQIAGQQIATVGDALEVYLTRHYRQLINLDSSPAPRFTGDYDSPAGARVCDANGCDITMTALTDEHMLDSSFANVNVFGAGYKLRITRRVLQATGCGAKGDQPCYKLTALAITDSPFYHNSSQAYVGRVRYDLLGVAVDAAGKHHGFTPPGVTSVVQGYQGAWSEVSGDFPAINQTGLLAARRGYETITDSEYLRRDGTLPMTGDLNLMHVDGGGQFYRHNILNANNITATRFVLGDKLMPSVIYGSRDGSRHTYIQQGGELRVADYDGNPGVIRAQDMFISNRGRGQIPVSDLIPTQSLRGSYWVKDGQTVPKPYCQNSANGSGTESKAKIVLYPGIQQILTMAYNRRMRVAEYNCPSDSIWTTWARDQGDHWTINLGSYATNNYANSGGATSDSDGNTTMAADTTPYAQSGIGNPSELNYVLAQTFCDYQGSQKSGVRELTTSTYTIYGNQHYQCALDGVAFGDSTYATASLSANPTMALGASPKDRCVNALYTSATYGNNINYPNPLSCFLQSDGTWTCKGRLPGFFNEVGCRVDAGGNILTLFGS